jgi:hypothetical protein
MVQVIHFIRAGPKTEDREVRGYDQPKFTAGARNRMSR